MGMEQLGLSLQERLAHLTDGHDVSPVAQMREALEQAQNYEICEVGLVHPLTHAAVKLRDDGAIDVFSQDVGVRIDPQSATVNLFGGIQHHASVIRQFVAGEMVADVKRSWTVRCAGPVRVEGRTVDVRADTDATVEVGGALTIRGAQDLAIETEQTLTLRARHDIKIRAGGFVDFD